jgi:hypothetical protein
MALDTVVRAVADTVDDDPDPAAPAGPPAGGATPGPRPTHGLVRWGASRWSWYDDTAAARAHGAARLIGPAEPGPGPLGSSSI